MKNRLPVYLENMDLPIDEYRELERRDNRKSYGYVSIMYLGSLIITIISLTMVLVMWSRGQYYE